MTCVRMEAYIHIVMHYLQVMQTLNLSHNLLKTLPTDIGRFVAMRNLYLAGNFWDVGGLPDSMGDMKSLKVLDLEGLPSANTW